MRIISLCLLFGIWNQQMHGQSAINLKFGLINPRFADETNGRHFGESFGLDMIVEDSRFLFIPGLHYQRYSVQFFEKRPSLLRRRDAIHQIRLPVSAGTWLYADRLVRLRVYAGGHFNFIVGVDENSQGLIHDQLKTVHPGWQAGGQLLFWKLTLDIRYFHDYRNVIARRPDSIARGWEFLFGIAL